MTLILAVDPGKRTGVGWLHSAGTAGMATFTGWEATDEDFAAWWMEELDGEGNGIDVVVCEGYKVTARTAQQDNDTRSGLWSIQLLGLLQYTCRLRGIPLVQQMPSDKAFASDAKLKKIGWWQGNPGEKGHRRDAARHALTYGVRNGLIAPERLL